MGVQMWTGKAYCLVRSLLFDAINLNYFRNWSLFKICISDRALSSIFCYFFEVGTEKILRRVHLSWIYFYGWIFFQLGQKHFLFYSKKCIEIKCFSFPYFIFNLLTYIRLLETPHIPIERDRSVLRLVGEEGLSNIEHLLLIEALIEVFLHLKGWVNVCVLWLSVSHLVLLLLYFS